jgi:hypothetical protein
MIIILNFARLLMVLWIAFYQWYCAAVANNVGDEMSHL